VTSQTKFSLLMEEGPAPGTTFALTKPIIILGREIGSDVDIIIPSPTVSRQHARISQQDDQWIIEDLGSSNGTFINGNRLTQEPKVLKVGDQIRLGGSVVFILQALSAPEPEKHKPPVGATMLADEIELPSPSTPPQLIVTVAGVDSKTYTLEKQTLTLGRVPENDIVIDSPIVSRFHARLEQVFGGYQLVVLPSASNPILFEGRPISGPHRMTHADVFRIGGMDPGLMVTMTFDSPSEAAIEAPAQIQLGDKTLLQIGRDPGNDVVLETPTVSRFHTQIERVGQRYRIRDLNSSNGTFVNEQRIEEEIWLKPDDSIRIGQHRFVMGTDALAQYDETHGLRADAIQLQKWVRKDLNILQDISVVFKPREFIVIVGQRGAGKSTRLDAISVYRPATHG